MSLLLPSAWHIKKVVDANPLELMSAIFNRPGQCTYAATCAGSETPPPSQLFCWKIHSPHPYIPPFSWLIWNGCSLVASAAHLDVCLYTPPIFLPLSKTSGHPLTFRPCHSDSLLLPSVPPMILQSVWALK